MDPIPPIPLTIDYIEKVSKPYFLKNVGGYKLIKKYYFYFV